mmetsp:Transcript_54868/g.133247  ORF Transcript_54868/g.133247 Transcript_54868/m.133247 type:complete len:276 (+) Transcript_54868:75-902(+)
MSLRESVRLGITRRTDFPIHKERAALLIIDVQKYCCEEGSSSSDASSLPSYYYAGQSLPRMRKNIVTLLSTFRTERDRKICVDSNSDSDGESNIGSGDGSKYPQQYDGGCEVIFVVIQAMTRDRRDLSLDYKLCGPYFAKVPSVTMSYEEIFLPDIMPDTMERNNDDSGTSRKIQSKGDIVIPKTACSVFTSTNIKYVLDNLFIEQLVVCGQLTDQCVESAVRDAADLGYLVSVVDDACAAHSDDDHQKGLKGMNGFSRIVSTEQVVKEMTNQIK